MLKRERFWALTIEFSRRERFGSRSKATNRWRNPSPPLFLFPASSDS